MSKQKTESLNINGTKCTSPAAIAEHFNHYFTHIGTELDKKIPLSTTTPLSYIPNTHPNSIFLSPCTEDEICKVIMRMKTCAAGWDGVSTTIIQENKKPIASCIQHIINLSLTQGIFPKELKTAILIPIFKTGDSDEPGNYRPISLLSSFSKIFERIFYTRLCDFLKKQKLLFQFQFGFREKYSSEMVIITLMDRIINALERGHFMVDIFLDFSKAFDTVNHQILLDKLYKYGIRGPAHKWVTHYLQDREQYCYLNGHTSTKLTIKCGVPQGSILGTLLFLVYINDLSKLSTIMSALLFADDSNLFVSGPSLTTLENIINAEMPKLVTWLTANHLSLNIGKTHLMVFGKKKNYTTDDINVKINNQSLEVVPNSKYLWCHY